MRSIRSLRKAFPSKSKDSIFAFFLRLTAATHKENKLYWEFFHFIISLLKYLKYWTTNTGKKYVFYDLGEDKRWFHGMLSNSFNRDFGFRWLASIKMSTLYAAQYRQPQNTEEIIFILWTMFLLMHCPSVQNSISYDKIYSERKAFQTAFSLNHLCVTLMK